MTVEFGTWRGCTIAFADGRLYIEAQKKPNLVGGIARGKIDRLVGTAAFVKLPGGAMGYLEKAGKRKPGETLLVQISGYATDDKAWPLSTELKLQGRHKIYLPYGKGIAASKRLSPEMAARLKKELALDFPAGLPGGWIIRSGGYTLEGRFDAIAEVQDLIDRAKLLETRADGWLIPPPTIKERAELDGGKTSKSVDCDTLAERMERLLQLELPLPSSGRLRLCPAPACFTIDVDAPLAANAAQASEDLAAEILRVIRSRAIGGQIVIDPVRAGAKNLLDYLKFFGAGEPQLTIYGITKMGLIELSRPRFGPSLYEALDDTC